MTRALNTMIIQCASCALHWKLRGGGQIFFIITETFEKHMIYYTIILSCLPAQKQGFGRDLHGIALMHFHAAAGDNGDGWGRGGGQCIPVMWVADTLICRAWKGNAPYSVRNCHFGANGGAGSGTPR